jgi:hypothetical protein
LLRLVTVVSGTFLPFQPRFFTVEAAAEIFERNTYWPQMFELAFDLRHRLPSGAAR